MRAIIRARNLNLGYYKDQLIIKNANFNIMENDFIFITGKSGSGKSTLLKSFYADIEPFSGELEVYFSRLRSLNRKKLAQLRQNIGIIFQDYRLINSQNVQKNVMLPLIIKGYKNSVCQSQANKLLSHVNMLHKADKFPQELSGGEQQRVAMARALAHNPKILLCDEPTGNLDEYSSDVIWSLLKSAKEFLNTSIVVVTHRIPTALRIEYKHFDILDGEINEVS